MEHITLSHGSGGKLMHRLIDALFFKELANPILKMKMDSAVLRLGRKWFAFTTDSYVVKPLFFPGGDIGSLAVYGTANDLAVCGARPLFISLGLIIEEGLDRAILEKVTGSIKRASRAASVKVITGDTKVVERGSCDRLFVNTSGIGEVYYEGLSVNRIRSGDTVIISGPIGEHAISVLSRREGLDFGSNVTSDSAPLGRLIRKALKASRGVRFMRDPTRGGLATTLNEIAERTPFGIAINETDIPVTTGVKSACELLGFDPLYLACEGRVVMIVKKEDSERVLSAMRRDKLGRRAAVIGSVVSGLKGKVYIKTAAGGKRLVDMLSGEQLPRIC
jgi:hydrogenase expression/formation protein HypE